ncbi:MAG: TonB-dependent receptor plug domain-containing protein [Pyrinomonadaceae bacterium]
MQVVLGKTTPVNIAVGVGSTSVTVDVSGSSDVGIDPTSSEISTSISTEKIQMLPKGAGFTSILNVSPGTRSEAKSGGFSIDGASGAENTFVIDGQEVTNYRNAGLNSNLNIPLSMVQQVQVKSSGFNAEYGGATGGVINVVTKGGNNDFHGEFGVEFNSAKLNGNPRQSLLRFTSGSASKGTFKQDVEYATPPKSDGVVFYPTLGLRGPIVKDKAWFSVNWAPTIVETNRQSLFYTNAPAASRTFQYEYNYQNKQTNQYGFARIDADPFSNLRLTGTFLWNPLIQQGTLPYGTLNFGNVGTLPDNARLQGGRQTANSVTFQAVYTPTSNLVGTFRF